jgi:hypothetical protein
LTDKTGDLEGASAHVGRVLDARRGEGRELTDARAVEELNTALELLGHLGFAATAQSSRRAPRSVIVHELEEASLALGPLRTGAEREVARRAGAPIETALRHLAWRARTPRSPALEEVIRVVASGAGSAKPLAEQIRRIADDLPSGVADPELERRRAIALAVVSAVRWIPDAAKAAGDADAGEPMPGLGHSELLFLAEFLHQQADRLPPQVAVAAADTEAALQRAGSWRGVPTIDEATAVAGLAAVALRIMVELRARDVFDEVQRIVDELVGTA